MISTEQIIGTIERFLFQSDENGFAVFILLTHNKKMITVRGYVPGINVGQQVSLHGNWDMHPKFGKQFNATECSAQIPTTILGLKKYLGSGLIKGIGPKYAEKLVDHFGESVLEVIDKEPWRLKEVHGIAAGRVDKITVAWQDQKEISHIMVFLQDKNISPAYATKIYKKYGNQSIAKVTENPYRLADEIWGIGFKTADAIAQNLGFKKDSPKRIASGVLFAISQATSNGHLYVELNNLKEQTAKLLELDVGISTTQLIKQVLHALYEQDKIKLISHDDKHFVTLPQYYYAEKGIAHHIQQLLAYTSTLSFDIDAIYQELRVPKNNEIALNEQQQVGVLTALQQKITIITGGPGTGKTTLIKKLLSIFDAHSIRYKLAAPTGRAAKRITESTRKPAVTLHRLLEFDPQKFGFMRNEQNALTLDFLIIDEASMIDTFLAYAIVKAIPNNAHLILIGDIDQLPSVGAGNVLKDLITSKQVPTIILTEIFRQAQNSMIVVNAHRVNHGTFPTSRLPDAKKDFAYIKDTLVEHIPKHLHTIFNNALSRCKIPKERAVVLTPMNRGAAGTVKLNYDLQLLLNPDTTKPQLQHSGTTFRVGDRVMQIRNNYDKLVFNGDTGDIETIDTADRIITVNFLGHIVNYEYSELDELVLAYAVSIHKSQGSEYDAVIIPLFMQHFMLLQRNLVYTAITRAKKLCIIIGDPKAIAVAIRNTKGNIRLTFLKTFLTSEVKCR